MDEKPNAGRETSDRAEATILVVDDEPTNLMVLSAVLQPHFRVRSARSGSEALAAINAGSLPNLILLDVMMPDMDGYAVLAKLRESPAYRGVPVIFVTALDSREDEQRGLELGAADYITKPISPAIVLARVRAQIDAKAARDLLKKANLQLVHQVVEGVHALEQAHLQLLQSDKMAAIGQLAAGVAHEINNPIAFVGSNLGSLNGYLQDLFSIIAAYEKGSTLTASDDPFDEARRLRREFDYDHLKQDVADLLRESRGGLERVRKIVLDLKNFSRVDKPDWEWSDVHECLDSTLNIVWNELKYHCTVTRNYGSLPQIRCLPSQLNQVFMNLLVNAGQAIEGNGEITITTECVGDAAVRVKISDTGAGIEPQALASVFNPFFTTKPIGKGTGLGLSLTWGIVERHGGKIEASSEPGKGATFTVTLPLEPKQST